MIDRITPNEVTELAANQVLVVPTNEGGRHGKGLAKFAHENFGLPYYFSVGLNGQCYCLPTKDNSKPLKVLPIEKIANYVKWFLYTSQLGQNRFKVFLVPEIGCGLAGYKPEQIAPLFKDAIDLPNVHLPKSFWEVL